MNIKAWKLNVEQQHINTQQIITIESITLCFDEGFHLSWATSPWSSLHSMGLCISLIFQKMLFIVSYCLYNLLQYVQNIKIYQEWLFQSQNWSKIAPVMGKTNFPTISPPNLEKTLDNFDNLVDSAKIGGSYNSSSN